jgi:quinolinate synthase
LHPVPSAGCPMADAATAEAVRQYKAAHPDVVLVAYVNSTAAVKAEVDVCCTSANAKRIVAAIPAAQPIMFLPDRNLGANVARALGRKMELWPGFCPTHDRIKPEDVKALRAKHPDAVVLVHPECTPAVVEMADHALSTGGMLEFMRESTARTFILGTECGVLHRAHKENPDKELIPLEPLPMCPNMKKITLESIVESLESLTFRVELDPGLMDRARLPVERMLAS